MDNKSDSVLNFPEINKIGIRYSRPLNRASDPFSTGQWHNGAPDPRAKQQVNTYLTAGIKGL